MIHRFDRFELDEDRYELRRASEGTSPEPIEVQPKVMEVLLHLVRNAGRTLTKDELLDAVWGDLAITEASLTRCISLARRALDDHEGEARIIKTVRGRGYALGVDVVVGEAGSPAAPTAAAPATGEAESTSGGRAASRLGRWWVPAATAIALGLGLLWMTRPFSAELVAPPAPARSDGPPSSAIAVLPFRDLRSATSRSLEADGLVVAVIERLSRWPELQLISPRSTFRFDPSEGLDTAAIGTQLGVGTLVLGTLRSREDAATRVHIEAVDAARGFQRWSESFSVTADGAGYAGIAERVARALGVDVELNPLRPSVAEVSAQEILLRGQEAVRTADLERLLGAVEVYERALELDPDLLRPYVALAEVYQALWEREGEMPSGNFDWLAASEAAALEALERAPDDPDALAAHGQVMICRRNWAAADASLDAALRSGGGARASSRMAALRMMTGRLEEAHPHVARAIRLDPLGDETLRIAGRFHLYAREPERAIGYLRRSLALEPQALYSPRLLANAYLMHGDLDAARETYYRILPGWARPWARLQDRVFGPERNLRWLAELDILLSGRRCRNDAHGTALLWAALGERERMLECLGEAARHHLWYVRAEPSFDPFRDDPDFRRIVRAAGFTG